MGALKDSDIWFGIVLAALFGLAAYLFFGGVATDPTFWLKLVVVVGFGAAVSFMHVPLDQLDRIPRCICWFSIGVTFVSIYGALADQPADLILIAMCGLAFVSFGFVPDRSTEKSGYGEEAR